MLGHRFLGKVALIFADAEADFALHRADADDLGHHLVAHVEHFLGLLHAVIRQFADVNQSLNAVLEPRESAEAHELRDLNLNMRPDRQLLDDRHPRVFFELLEAHADLLGFRVDAQNLDLDFLALLQHFRRIVDLLRP